jgi:hypothetical protein
LIGVWAVWLLAIVGAPVVARADPPPAPPAAAPESPPPAARARAAAALQNILDLERPGQDGYATVWDGNKYVQCARTPDRRLRCEAAGMVMQPSLADVLTPERAARLTALGWALDPSFGSYVRAFPRGAATDEVADAVLQVLSEAYDADLTRIDFQTAWVAHQPCPPRNGPRQNDAGMVDDAPSMAATAVRACAYRPPLEFMPKTGDAAGLIALYGSRVASEIQRLRVNLDREVFVIFDAGIGYVQCAPETRPEAIECEAQSPRTWQALASVITPERLARLHAVGFADPGRSPNYWKYYPLSTSDSAIAAELLTLLHDVYGYTGASTLKVSTEADASP